MGVELILDVCFAFNMTPRAVVMKTGLKPLKTARLVNSAHPKTTVYRARPMSCFSKLAQSTVKRPYQSRTALTNKNSNQKVNTAKEKVYTAKPKVVNTARPTSAVVNAVRANQVNAVKASACWVWRPTKLNSASITFKRPNYIDARGRYKIQQHSYLSDFKELMRGYVTFLGDEPERRITNRVIIVKPHNKTPYELFRGRTPALSFMRPFGCHVTILNTLDHLGKFDGKSDDGFFVGHSLTSKAFRVYNIRTRKVEENLHIRFLKNKLIVTGDGLKWLFDIDSLTKSMNYVPVVAGTNSNDFADGLMFDSSSKISSDDEPQPPSNAEKKDERRCKRAIATKWIFRNKKDERGIVTRNKARLVAQGYTQEERIYYDEVSAHVARIEAISHPDKVYKVVKALYGLHQAPRAWSMLMTLSLAPDKQRSCLQVKQIEDGIFISQDKYVVEILRKFGFTDVRTASTPMDTEKPLLKDSDGDDVDCKKQTVVATSSTEAEYMGAASCCGQVLWIQNQMLDYGYNFMHTMINIDNNSTICIVKNPVSHTKTKHIEIRYHFIRDCYDKKLIQVVKIHTDHNFADLLTKALDVGRICTARHIEYLVGDEAVHKELGDRMERAATTASSLEVEQDSGTIKKQQRTPTLATLMSQVLRELVQVVVPEQFWQTASASTLENGDIEITATIDGKVKVVSEASIRIHLKLEDSDGCNRYPRKDKNSSQNNKTEHENGKSVKEKSKLKPNQKVKVKSKSTLGIVD
ncbi:retrovirus-related pol polyprotein from transposon TNT 1-94 [Tanacetum coccineum]